MSRWFRFYDDAVDDFKVQQLPSATFKAWINLLCIASKNDGRIKSAEILAFRSRISDEEADKLIKELVAANLLDARIEGGWEPHNWSERQYIDPSRDRVKRYRAKRKAAGLVQQWTISKASRRSIYERDNNQCVYCGSGNDLTIDHKIPEFRGGDHSFDNLQTCCRKCNAAKRDMTHEEYVASNGLVTPRTEQNTEQNTDQKVSKRRTQKIPLPLDWRPPERSRVLASQLGLSIEPIEAQFRDYLASNAKHYADYDAAFCNFVRNAPKFNGGRNGVDRSLVKAADRLIERAKAGDFSFGPRPGSIAGAVAPDVRLLPERRGD
jgi:5-methylcytosine-specific restriction endonuclease McrA